MDFELEKNYTALCRELKEQFRMDVDLPAVLMLIGMNELKDPNASYSKREKMELMHVATCRVLEPFGFYELAGYDADGWPHFETREPLPHLSEREQQELLKRGVVHYFENYETRIPTA